MWLPACDFTDGCSVVTDRPKLSDKVGGKFSRHGGKQTPGGLRVSQKISARSGRSGHLPADGSKVRRLQG